MIRNPNYLLCISSAAFFVTSYYGYLQQSKLFVLDLASATFSLIYWCDPNNKNKRNMDIVAANIMGIYFFIYGNIFIEGNMRYLAWFNLAGILSCFTISCIYHSYNYRGWKWFHFAFHAFTFINKIIYYANVGT